MLHTVKIDIANTISESNIADFLNNAAWAICYTYHTVKHHQEQQFFGREILFEVLFLAAWSTKGEYRQNQTKKNTEQENISCIDLNYQLGDKVLLQNDGTPCKTESQ